MYDLKNSIKNINRNKKRYMIVAILIFTISFISVISMIVNQSSQSTVEYYLNEYGATATIDMDPEQMSASFSKGDASGVSDAATITYDDYEKYADSEYVNSVSYQQRTSVVNEDLETSDPEETDEESAETTSELPQMDNGAGREMQSGSFTLIGSDTLESSSYFAEDANIVVDGELPTSTDEVIISSDLADYNDLKTGDTISFSNSTDDNEVELTISGLYQAASSEQMMMGIQTNIFTTYDTVSEFTSEKSNITATYELVSYDMVDQFEAELYEKGLDEMYYVNNNQSVLEQIIGPVEATMNILNNVLIVVFLIGGTILVFINLLILRERKYEIGVLRALGMKTSKVTKGLAMEAIIVALIAMIIATFVGMLFAQPISDTLIASNNATDIAQMGMETGRDGMMGKGQSMTAEETVTSIEVTMNMMALIVTFGINIVLILITTIVSSRYINRQHPNEILREQ